MEFEFLKPQGERGWPERESNEGEGAIQMKRGEINVGGGGGGGEGCVPVVWVWERGGGEKNTQSMISEVTSALFSIVHPPCGPPPKHPPPPHQPLTLAASLSFLLQRCHGDREMWEYLCPSERERVQESGKRRFETEGARKEGRKEGRGADAEEQTSPTG